jgi:hypothetical protein
LDKLFDGLESGCSLFDRAQVPEAFVKQIRECSRFFRDIQVGDAIGNKEEDHDGVLYSFYSQTTGLQYT